MTEQHARTTANAILAGAAIGAAAVVLRSPSLRRQAWQIARAYAMGPLAVFLATTVRNAWVESGQRRGVSVR
jgi:hypothetical protein